MYPRSAIRLDGLTVVGLGLILFMAFNVIRDAGDIGMDGDFASAVAVSTPAVSINLMEPEEVDDAAGGEGAEEEPAEEEQETEEQDLGDTEAVAAPYEDYKVTQGPHGFSYGHMAIDLAAGKGATILSPINGEVTAVYIDEYGNPTVEIENEAYFVTMLHGDYTVEAGDRVGIGEPVGSESNKGYTTNMNGVPCWGREGCGYHTHLNIYDKHAGSNVNPLDLIGE